MKSTGLTRKLDDLGRLVLPAEIRRRFGLYEGSFVEIEVEGDRIVLSRLGRHCVFCDSPEQLQEFRERPVCSGCVDELSTNGRPRGPAAAG